jgi:DNA-binding beta-propeller fold protein YncE
VEPGRFYGPRDIAVSPSGDVLVADTGNKRIQVFDQRGEFRRAFGTEGSAPAQFREPVGLAVGRDGRIYVADTWNQRIQVFDSQFQHVAQHPVQGWNSQSVTNKPYLAVADDGTIFATIPERRAVVRVSDGETATLNLPTEPRLQMPIGIEVGSDGRVLVVDSQSGVVILYGVSSPARNGAGAAGQAPDGGMSGAESSEPASGP